MVDNFDLEMLRKSFIIAENAENHGNHPFGAILVDANGNILLEIENTVLTDEDCTHHAETNLVSLASRKFAKDILEGCTLYASTEPCPMCAGAIYWSGIGRVVFGLSQEGLYTISGGDDRFILSCNEVILRGVKPIEVVDPLLEDEAGKVHAGFWS